MWDTIQLKRACNYLLNISSCVLPEILGCIFYWRHFGQCSLIPGHLLYTWAVELVGTRVSPPSWEYTYSAFPILTHSRSTPLSAMKKCRFVEVTIQAIRTHPTQDGEYLTPINILGLGAQVARSSHGKRNTARMLLVRAADLCLYENKQCRLPPCMPRPPMSDAGLEFPHTVSHKAAADGGGTERGSPGLWIGAPGLWSSESPRNPSADKDRVQSSCSFSGNPC